MRKLHTALIQVLLAALFSAILAGQESVQIPSGQVPGVVIDHSPARTGQYIGSPSIAILPDGSYVASHDLFGAGSTLDRTRQCEIEVPTPDRVQVGQCPNQSTPAPTSTPRAKSRSKSTSSQLWATSRRPRRQATSGPYRSYLAPGRL